jgi:CheY-like chemotaxis protein
MVAMPEPKFKNILLVDDDAITVIITDRIIKHNGFAEEVIALNNGQEALDYLAKCADGSVKDIPEIIFLDLNMPIMDGWEFLEHYQKLSFGINNYPPVYILSSTADSEDQKKGMSYSFVKKFISKPLLQRHLEMIAAEYK